MNRWLMMILSAIMPLVLGACTVQPVASTPTPTKALAESGDTAVDLSGEVIVFGAASLTDAFGEIATKFQAEYPDTTIVYNFAGSQQLAQQLGQGAPADVFASANGTQMNVAIEAGRVISGTPLTFVRNRLVVIYPSDNPGEIVTLQDLAKPGLQIVLAAPAVPIGAYSLDFLKKATANIDFGENFSQTVLSNVVSYEENVRSVLSKVALGEADAGIVYTSDIFGENADLVAQMDIPDEMNTLASYPIAAVADSANPDAAAAFVAYVLDEAGQTVLADYGFIPIDGMKPTE